VDGYVATCCAAAAIPDQEDGADGRMTERRGDGFARSSPRGLMRGTLRDVEAWGFIWIMLVLKIPLVALLGLVWYAVKATPDPIAADEDDDGGINKPRPHDPAGPGRPRRRGPHGDPLVPAPPRSRTTVKSRERLPR
jgi:hypothetical protein